MKLLSLKIQGFGPYLSLKLSEEDFKLLTEPRLFLISGEIGAGKTTIFDAILYALYGETSVEGRSVSQFVSQYVQGTSVIPEVDLKFFLDGKTYRIVRRPRFQHKKELANLWINDKLVLTDKKEVTNRIVKLLSLNAKQFKKVFLIPQGEYRKLLLSPRDEFLGLLQAIFDTHFFSELEGFLKDKTKELKKDFETLTQQEKEVKNFLKVCDQNEARKKVSQLLKREGFLKERTHILLKELDDLKNQLAIKKDLAQLNFTIKKLQEKKKTLEEKESEIRKKEELLKKLRIVKEYIPFYHQSKRLWVQIKTSKERLKTLDEEKRKLRKALTTIKVRLNSLLEEEKRIKEIKEEVIRLEDVLKKFEQTESIKNRIKELQKGLEALVKRKNELEEEIKRCKSLVEEFSEAQVLLAKAGLIKQELEKKEELLKKFEEEEALIEKEKNLKEELEKLKREKAFAEKKLKQKELTQHLKFVVKYLKPGEPCPLCGAKEHPSPFKCVEEDLEEDKLEELEDKIIFIEKNLYSCEVLRQNISDALKGVDKGLIKREVADLTKTLRNWGISPEVSIKEINELRIEKEKKLKSYKNLLCKLESEFLNCEKELNFRQKEVSELKGTLYGLQEGLSSRESPSLIANKIKELKKEVASWERQKESLERELKTCEEALVKVETQTKEIQEFLNNTLHDYREVLSKLGDLKKRGIIRSLVDLKPLEKELESIPLIEKEVEEFKASLLEVKIRLEESLKEKERLEKSIATPLSEEEISSKVEKLNAEIKAVHEELGAIRKELTQLEDGIIRLKELEKKKKRVEAEFSSKERLLKLISGKNSRGVSFHSFVLSLFTQALFKQANTYLKEFSFGRYRFVCEEILQKKAGIEVFDSYTGQKREVKTLSGGESFLASLSLALGISDVILYLFRSAPFESLFIDEGFGALDEATLEKVMSVLLNLATKTGRVIGIISHLKVLKEKFPVVLEVYKNPVKGSYVKIKKQY